MIEFVEGGLEALGIELGGFEGGELVGKGTHSAPGSSAAEGAG